jgi:hypothetical protein
MMRKLLFFAPPLALLLLLLLSGRPALAQSTTAATIAIYDQTTGAALTTADLLKYFNKARCDCNKLFRVRVGLSQVPTSSDSNYITVLAGRNCLNSQKYIKSDSSKDSEPFCSQLFGQRKLNTIYSTIIEVSNIPASYFFMKECSGQDIESYGIFVFTSDDQQSWTQALVKNYSVDTYGPLPPKAASGTAVAAGESLVEITFASHMTSSTSGNDGGATIIKDNYFLGYQILCEKVDSSGNSLGPGFSTPPASPIYQTAATLCNGTSSTGDSGVTADAAVHDAKVPDAKVPDSRAPDTRGPDLLQIDGLYPDSAKHEGHIDSSVSPDTGPDAGGASDSGSSDSAGASKGLQDLDKAYVCSEKLTTAGTTSITGLENGSRYHFYAITVDTELNPSTLLDIGEGAPVLEEDLWERYKRSGGTATGGNCFVATAAYGSSDHPQVQILRELRDRELLTTGLGSAFVLGYYRMSPGPASWLGRHDGARLLARAALWPITLGAAVQLRTSPLDRGLLVAALACALAALGLCLGAGPRRGGRGGGRS